MMNKNTTAREMEIRMNVRLLAPAGFRTSSESTGDNSRKGEGVDEGSDRSTHQHLLISLSLERWAPCSVAIRRTCPSNSG